MRALYAFLALMFTLFTIALLVGVFVDKTTADLSWGVLVAMYYLGEHLVSNAVAALKAVF